MQAHSVAASHTHSAAAHSASQAVAASCSTIRATPLCRRRCCCWRGRRAGRGSSAAASAAGVSSGSAAAARCAAAGRAAIGCGLPLLQLLAPLCSCQEGSGGSGLRGVGGRVRLPAECGGDGLPLPRAERRVRQCWSWRPGLPGWRFSFAASAAAARRAEARLRRPLHPRGDSAGDSTESARRIMARRNAYKVLGSCGNGATTRSALYV